MDLNTRLFPYLDGQVFRVVLYNKILFGYAVKWSFQLGVLVKNVMESLDE